MEDQFMAALFLWLAQGSCFHMLDIECNLFLLQDLIFFQMWDVLGFQPSRRGLLGIRLCMRRLRCIHPSPLPRLFHVCQVSWEVLLDPKRCVRYVLRQLAFSFENLDL